MKSRSAYLPGLAAGLGLVWATVVWGHAFPARSEPRVGAVARTAPTRVQIWFDGELEPAFSTLSVTDAAGTRVDRGDARVDGEGGREESLPGDAVGPRDVDGDADRHHQPEYARERPFHDLLP